MLKSTTFVSHKDNVNIHSAISFISYTTCVDHQYHIRGKWCWFIILYCNEVGCYTSPFRKTINYEFLKHVSNKPDRPIRPVVNWRNASAYKLAKLFTQKVVHLAPLPNAVNTQNSKTLIHELKDTPIMPHFNMASLDITNLYTNIPVTETGTIFAVI